MRKLKFDSQGRFAGIKDRTLDREDNLKPTGLLNTYSSQNSSQKFDNSQDTKYWSLYKNDQILPPLRFSNGKTQEDVVEEIVNLIRTGTKVIFLHGVCGTGKSAIALNIARVLGKTSIVVPIKNLQRQYKEDYMGSMFLLKPNREKLRISMITGRANHDSVFEQGVSCANPFLPDTIQIIEKNYKKVKKYYDKNPLIEHKTIMDVKQLKRVSIAPTNPYWSPIIPSQYNMNLPDAKQKSYRGLKGRILSFIIGKKDVLIMISMRHTWILT